MSKRRPPTATPRTKVEALDRVAQLDRQVRSLKRRLESSARRADEAVRKQAEAQRELSEALEQQTATADILRIISASPTDPQLVLEAVVRSAVRFCGAHDATICQIDEGRVRVGAHEGPIPQAGLIGPLTRGLAAGRAILDRQAIHVADLQAEETEFPVGSASARELGHRTTLAVPLLREGVALGAIALRRTEVNPFTDKQIAVLQTFADQAAIDRERLLAVLARYRRDRPVLIVEDDAPLRELLRRMLEREGYAVVEAEHGQAALERVWEGAPGVILLDLMMPVMDGFEFLGELRRSR